MQKIRTYFLILGFTAILFLPILLKTKDNVQLSGVSEAVILPSFNLKGIWDGSFQETVETYYSENLPGRELMIKLRNQTIFSLFGKSPNKHIIIGKDHVLFELEYVLKYEKFYPSITEEFAQDLCSKLAAIQEQLKARGKEMYIFITPTKVRYYESYLPDRYLPSNHFSDSLGNYEVFSEALKQYHLPVYDSIPYINNLAQTADFPLFYKTGTHWSWILSTEVTKDFLRFLNENSQYTFPDLKMDYFPIPEPLPPDADIFHSLNLLIPPYDTYYGIRITPEFQAEERPNLFCRGGSFMGQTIGSLINNGYFNKDTYIENTEVSHNQFSESTIFSDYSELALKQEFDQADIIIFEVNESHIPVMSFSLIDYLTEHPEFLFMPNS